jgi:hypothetical protein
MNEIKPTVYEILPMVRAFDSQCRIRNCPGFDPSNIRHSGIGWVADEAVLNKAQEKRKKKEI